MTAFVPLLLLVATAPITEANWRTHPRIVAIREQVEAIEAAIKARTFPAEEAHYPGCLEYRGDMDRSAFRDGGVIRKLVLEAGSSDSAMTTNAYYDAKGVLIFVFVQRGAVNGAQLRERLYFEGKRRVWENRELELGYTFGPLDALPFDAKARWALVEDCQKDD